MTQLCKFCKTELVAEKGKRKKKATAEYCSSTCWHREYRASDEGWAKDCIRKAKQRSRSIHKGFDIDIEFLLTLLEEQNRCCAITGVEFSFRHDFDGRIDQYRASVDRIDSNRGYTKDNVQLVCAQVNIMKHQSNLEELIFWASKIVEGTR